MSDAPKAANPGVACSQTMAEELKASQAVVEGVGRSANVEVAIVTAASLDAVELNMVLLTAVMLGIVILNEVMLIAVRADIRLVDAVVLRPIVREVEMLEAGKLNVVTLVG
jgi:hypothetical protein